MPEKENKTRRMCPTCEGFAIRLCPWCKVDSTDKKGKVIQSKPGPGCRACLGASIFKCTQCDGKGYLPQEEIEISRGHLNTDGGYMREY